MTGSSGPTIASTFWKKLIHGAMSCDQLTFSDSVLCSRKLPGGVEELLRDDRRPQPRLGERDALAGLVGATALEVLPHRRHVEHGDLLAVEHPDPARSLTERHELHALTVLSSLVATCSGHCAQLQPTPQTRIAIRAYVSAVRTRPSISRFSPFSTSIRPGRGAVVDGRDPVARQRRGIGEPPRHVALRHRRRRPPRGGVDRRDELVPLVDLGAGRGHVHLALDRRSPGSARRARAPCRAPRASRRPSASSAAPARRGRDRRGAACARRASRSRPRSRRR